MSKCIAYFLLLNMCGNEVPVIFIYLFIYYTTDCLQEINSVGFNIVTPQMSMLSLPAEEVQPCLRSCMSGMVNAHGDLPA